MPAHLLADTLEAGVPFIHLVEKSFDGFQRGRGLCANVLPLSFQALDISLLDFDLSSPSSNIVLVRMGLCQFGPDFGFVLLNRALVARDLAA
jgi:hypothetical protein